MQQSMKKIITTTPLLSIFLLILITCLITGALAEQVNSPTKETTPKVTNTDGARGTEATKADKTKANKPEASMQAPKPAPQIEYTVAKGDCIEKIAKTYNVSSDALAVANGFEPKQDFYLIKPGQKLIIPSDKQNETSSSSNKAQEIIDSAMAYRGVRYRYGGMSSRGIDCSGLVARVMLNHGIKMPHSSRELYKQGTPVSKTSLQPGDLVFFRTTSRQSVSHVGIYIGEGEFIHASSGKGYVRTDTLLEGYYNDRYVGARRILE